MPQTGSCLCGGVSYEIAGAIGPSEYCHCSMCRKAHGSAFSVNAEIPASSFRLSSGAELITEFASSTQRRKSFCGRCGSQLFIRRLDDPDTLAITLGTLDSDPLTRPERHVFVDSKARWYDITDDLPRFRIYPGFEPED